MAGLLLPHREEITLREGFYRHKKSRLYYKLVGLSQDFARASTEAHISIENTILPHEGHPVHKVIASPQLLKEVYIIIESMQSERSDSRKESPHYHLPVQQFLEEFEYYGIVFTRPSSSR